MSKCMIVKTSDKTGKYPYYCETHRCYCNNPFCIYENNRMNHFEIGDKVNIRPEFDINKMRKPEDFFIVTAWNNEKEMGWLGMKNDVGKGNYVYYVSGNQIEKVN